MKVLIKLKCTHCGQVEETTLGAPPGEQPQCPECGNIMMATSNEIIHEPGEKERLEAPPKPPFVHCKHGLRRGYIVCIHVETGIKPNIIELSKGKETGTILCSDEVHHDVNNLILTCEGCAIERGWINAEDCERRDARESRPKVGNRLRSNPRRGPRRI